MWLIIISIGILLYAFYLLKKCGQRSMNKWGDAPVYDGPIKYLVLYYKNGCPPCERIKPTWKTLEDVFKDSKEVKIIKIDVEDPTSEIVDPIEGTPDIYLKYDGKVKQYGGDRSLESLMQFIISE